MDAAFDHKLNTIKWIGILTMTIDHIGYFLFPEFLWLRVVGRLAFPCFLYSTIEGTQRTKNYANYISRLLLLGILSMPVTPNTLNVLFLLVLFSLSMKYKRAAPVFFILSIFVEYSVYGMLLGWGIYWLKEKNRNEGIVFSILVQFLGGSVVQLFSLLAFPFFLMKQGLKIPRVPRYFFYVFYPLHQLILVLLATHLTIL